MDPTLRLITLTIYLSEEKVLAIRKNIDYYQHKYSGNNVALRKEVNYIFPAV